jgi:outer membrane protein assembly factor BamB
MYKKFVASLLMVSFVSPLVLGENWDNWRGPTKNGGSLTAKPPTEWSDSKNVKWKAEIPGLGSSSPIVWENQVFITSGVPAAGSESSSLPTLEFTVLAYDRTTGKLNWKQVATVAKPHQETHSTNNFASASPCTDGTHVYAHFGSRGLYCYTMDGKLVWKRDDFGQMNTRNSFGEGSSPALAGDKLIVPWDHEGPSALYALDKKTGKTLWKVDRDEPTNWSTPHIVEYQGKKQIVMNGQRYARAYDLETGKELWRCGGQTERPCATAVSEGELVFVGSGFRGAYMGAFRLDGQGDIKGSKNVVWDFDHDTPDVPSPVLSNGRLYFYKGKVGQLSCLDAKTGKPFYVASRVRDLDTIYASPVAANGYVYLTARNGNTVVIRDSEKLEIVATNSVGETVDATPALVDNEIFIRGEKNLFCISK